MIAYIDDLRAIGFSIEQAWLIARRVASYLQYLGIQGRFDEGPWAGGTYSTSDKSITKTVTKEKWIKARTLIQELQLEINQNPGGQLSHKN